MKPIHLIALSLLALESLSAQAVRPALPVESSPEERARYLAAIPLPPESKLADRQKAKIYLEHVTALNKLWNRFNSANFQKQLLWSQTVMAPRIPPPSVLYYLFSGPDFINAITMFPDCRTYILCGLEPIGQLTAPETLNDAQLDQSLDNLRKALATILEFSFFITKDMKVDLEQTEFKGVLPILYTFLALSGCQILDVKFLTLSTSGALLPEGSGAPLVQIQFSRGATHPPQTLYYIRLDLSDKGDNAGLFSWMNAQPLGAGYLKAASYLMHETYFSRVRNFLLKHCTSILQDDSGIPFQYFDPKEWQIYLFGNYKKPIELFETKLQADYQNAYASYGSMPLPFGTGYNWKTGESNLMLAVRRSAMPATLPGNPGMGNSSPENSTDSPMPPAVAPQFQNAPARPIMTPPLPVVAPPRPQPVLYPSVPTDRPTMPAATPVRAPANTAPTPAVYFN